jgi:ferredoxin-NADP reductase
MVYLARKFDDFVNQYTLYKIVLYGLVLLLGYAFVLCLLGVVQLSPGWLAASAVVLGTTTYVVNQSLGWLFKVPLNSESWLITALILTCILPVGSGAGHLLLLVLAGVIAMASKFIITYRGGTVFNPAAFAAVALGSMHLLSANWWIATKALLSATLLLGIVVVYKVRRIHMALLFAVSAVAMLAIVGLSQERTLPSIIMGAFFSWPIVFFGSIMLTEPSTTPAQREYQLLYGGLVGVIFAAQLSWGPLSTTPELALLIGNLITVALSPGFSAITKLVRTEKHGVYYDFIFAKPKGFDFIAGQYLEWTLEHKDVDIRGNRRTFSIASSPTESELRIGTKIPEQPTSFKRALRDMKPGKTIRLSKLSGTFTLPVASTKHVVLIAGGIGITPFRSMLQHLIDTGQHQTMSLIYVAATADDFRYKEIIEAAAPHGVAVQYLTGVVDATAFQKALPDITSKTFYISGPNKMVNHYRDILRSRGVAGNDIKSDFFAGY